MKERLTGAIILVILIVLLVPELLSGPKGPSGRAPAASSSEEAPLKSYTINLGEESHSRTPAAGSSGPAMPQPGGSEQPAPASAAEAAAPASVPKPPGQASAPPPTAQASSHEQPAVNPVPPASKPEPPASKPEPPARPPSVPAPARKTAKPASRPATKLANATPKPEPPPVEPSAAESGWAVQLGVFASRENAERLALDVRVKGFKVNVSPIMIGSRKLFRVRVGPAPDPAGAQELQKRLKAIGRPGGAVVPYS